MATAQLDGFLRHLRKIAIPREMDILPDGQLLRQFVEQRDEAAFTALLRRHGPMVLGVCRQVLRDTHAAEDAFQATFLVLLHKAPSITRPELLGNWLYGVAYFTARNAHTSWARRRRREQRATERRSSSSFATERHAGELQPLLEELARLPERYRQPVVLCDLQGRTRKEAACRIGCPEGTVSSRLARAHALLRRRLARRGFALSGAGLLALALARDGLAAPL
jgi:RNA polymerase sigma factor (sigma-70 family)